MEPGVIAATAERLRSRRRDLHSAYGYAGVQTRVIWALEDLARSWREPSSQVRALAEQAPGTFPYEMVDVSLSALLDSFNSATLRSLVRSEPFDRNRAPEVVGHIVAGNTPLLAWTTIARSLMIGSASIVKVPSNAESIWCDYFTLALAEVAPEIASLVESFTWSGASTSFGRLLCESVDIVAVYGSDETVAHVREIAGTTPIVDYGHRISAAIVLDGANVDDAAEGLATDVLMYDQGGCLSPHTIFVEGDYAAAIVFGDALARAMDATAFGNMPRRASAVRSARVREARAMAFIADPVRVWQDDGLLWTIIATDKSMFKVSPTHGIVYLVPFARNSIQLPFAEVAGHLQGVAIAASSDCDAMEVGVHLTKFGVSYICKPGKMQSPPISWRENERDVLRSLIRK